jgi:hypothetical protein
VVRAAASGSVGTDATGTVGALVGGGVAGSSGSVIVRLDYGRRRGIVTNPNESSQRSSPAIGRDLVPSVAGHDGRYTPSMARFRRSEDLPFGVVVVAFGFLLNAFLFALAMAGMYDATRVIVQVVRDATFLEPVYVTVLAIEILAAILLLRRNPFGWVLAMLLVCASLAFLLGAWWAGSPEYPRMAIFAAMALYLNQREVRIAFAWHPRVDAGKDPVDEGGEVA